MKGLRAKINNLYWKGVKKQNYDRIDKPCGLLTKLTFNKTIEV